MCLIAINSFWFSLLLYLCTAMCFCHQMPVQPEYYCKVKPVCDELAVLASRCHEKEFVKRFDFLEAVCKSWAQSDKRQRATLAPSSGIVEPHDGEVHRENLPQQQCEEHGTVMCSDDNVRVSVVADVENLLTDHCNSEPSNDYVQSEIGRLHVITVSCSK